VSIKIFESQRRFVQTPAFTFLIEGENRTVRHVLELIAGKSAQYLEEESHDVNGRLNRPYSILVSGRSLETLSGMMTLSKNADVVNISPVMEEG
jgi:molybdopterin converting factor small subunit